MPHLWMFLLQALTPSEHEVLLIDGNARAMTDAELVKGTGIRAHQQVNQICRRLADWPLPYVPASSFILKRWDRVNGRFVTAYRQNLTTATFTVQGLCA